MTTQRLPFPVPDERAHYFVDSYANMHDLVEDLVVPDGAPEAAATVLRTARELLRQSYYCYEFSTVAVMHSLIAVEIVLRDRIPDAGKKPLHQLIKQGAADGILTARQAEYLDYGRQIRNGMAHGQTTHAVMPPAMAIPMVTTSFTIVSELCAAPVRSHPSCQGAMSASRALTTALRQDGRAIRLGINGLGRHGVDVPMVW